VKVALLGIIDPSAPTKAIPGRFGSLVIKEPVAAANGAAHDARAAGASAVIVLSDMESTGTDSTGAHTGQLIELAKQLQGVDLVLGYRATAPGTTRIGDTLVVENEAKGRTYTRAHLKIANGAVTVDAEVVEPDKSKVTPDPAAEDLLAPYRAQLSDAYDKVIATTSAIYPRDGNQERINEAAIGDLVADAFLAKYKPNGVQLAFMNSGGIRDAIPSVYAPKNTALRRSGTGYAAGPPFDVVAGDIYTVLPFGDLAVVRTISGTTLWAMLEHAVFNEPTAATRFLQIAGFKMTYKVSAAPGARVQSVVLDDGTPVVKDDAHSYTIVLPDIISDGADAFAMLTEASPTPGREVMADVLLEYVASKGTLSPTIAGRIVQVP
jgi:5'-nucleotidase